jgi:glycosyltransferase involved in cell wall biosynthesis
MALKMGSGKIFLFIDAPVLRYKGKFYFSDKCYYYTIYSLLHLSSDIRIISRIRNVNYKPRGGSIDKKIQLILINESQFLLATFFKLLQLSYRVFKKLDKFDIVYSDSILFSLIIIGFPHHLKRANFVYEIRNYVVVNYQYLSSRFGILFGSFIFTINCFLIKNIVSIAKRVIVIDIFPENLIGLWHKYQNKIQVLSDAYIEVNSLTDTKYSERAFFLNFLYVGHLELVKRVDWIIKSFSMLHKENNKRVLTIIGDGAQKEYLKNLALEYNIESSIRFLGTSTDVSFLNKHYKDSDLTLLASITETGPRVILEAINQDTLVFSTRCGRIGKLIHENCTTSSTDLSQYTIDLLNFVNKSQDELIYLNYYNRSILSMFKKEDLLKDRTLLFNNLLSGK